MTCTKFGYYVRNNLTPTSVQDQKNPTPIDFEAAIANNRMPFWEV